LGVFIAKKELSLYKIRDLALKGERRVFSIQQVSNLVGKPNRITKVYAARLVKNGLAKKLQKGKISFTEDEFIISTQLIEPSYISFVTALNMHHLIMQVPARIDCATTKRNYYNKALGLYYHKIPKELLFGYAKERTENSYYFLAEPEKALIDCIYLNTLSKNTIKEITPNLDKQKLEEYANKLAGKGAKKVKRWINA
jgi:predicted transcriptional regulator of viral defense system